MGRSLGEFHQRDRVYDAAVSRHGDQLDASGNRGAVRLQPPYVLVGVNNNVLGRVG